MQHMLVKQIFVINYNNRNGVSFLPLSRCLQLLRTTA